MTPHWMSTLAATMAACSLALCSSACGDDAPGGTGAADVADSQGVDGTTDDAAETSVGPDTVDEEVRGDVGEEADVAPTRLPLKPTIATHASDPLEGSSVESCPIYLDDRCVDGERSVCEIYDPAGGVWVDAPDPLLRRVFLYDRWYDLHSSPDGQRAERVFTGPMPGDTPEEVWADPANFERYVGAGDSAIWTSIGLVAATMRYAVTGTETDYQRMEEATRTVLRFFDVTGVPGFISRFHFLWYPDVGAVPYPPEHILFYGPQIDDDSRHNPIEDPASVDGLPAPYFDGLPAADGTLVEGIPMWNGHPSLDQYTGPSVAFPLVWPLLRDDSLRDRIRHQMTCYLNRLQRLDIINLQANPDVLESLTSFLGGANIQLDDDDIDLLALDSLVLYYHRGLNDANRDTLDRSCPEDPAWAATEIIDAADDATFLLDMFEFAADIDEDSYKPPRERQIDHIYAPNVRGGDASHLIHLSVLAHYFTGDERYVDFLETVVIDELRAPEVALTMQAFREPDVCIRFYGDHITYATHWQLLTMLEDSTLRTQLARAMEEELWVKTMHSHHSAKFNVMYASALSDDEASGRGAAIEMAALTLEGFGGNDGVIDAPRRTHQVDRGDVIAQLPDGITVVCPSEDDRDRCERDGDLLGVPVPGQTITYACDGRAGECVMEDGLCIEGIASEGLPPTLRRYGDFMWQRSPFEFGGPYGVDGQVQSPGRDLSESYWMARYYEFVMEGSGQVLAWRPSGTCP